MSDPNDTWGNGAGDRGDYDRSPRGDRDGGRDRARSPPPPARGRSRSPGGPRNGGDDRGRPAEEGNRGDNLHVSGLARSVNQQQLDEIFNKHGKVQKAELMTDPHTQESRGFGFVKMQSNEDAEACITALNGTVIDGKTITVAHARRGRARTPTPGRYHGVKVEIGGPRGGGYGGGYGGDRPYQPRSYDSRYSDRGPPRGGYYDDRRGGYDDRRGGYDDRRYDDRRDYRPRYDDRGPPPSDRDYYPRSYDRGGYDRRDDRPRYDERPRY